MGMIKEAPHSINLLISSLRGGGAEGVAVNLANSLAERGWQVNLIVLHLSNAVYRARLLPKVNLVSLDVSNIRYSLLPLGKFFLKNEVETVVVFNNELTVVAILLRIILRKKIKIVSRNINTLSEIRKQPAGVWKKVFVRPIVDLLYKRVD